jgi:hypothetical protein
VTEVRRRVYVEMVLDTWAHDTENVVADYETYIRECFEYEDIRGLRVSAQRLAKDE